MPPGGAFQLYFSLRPDRFHDTAACEAARMLYIKHHFQSENCEQPQLSICVSDGDFEQTSEHLVDHKVECFVLCARGIDILDASQFYFMANPMFDPPHAALIFLAYGAKAAAQAAVRAGTKFALWCEADVLFDSGNSGSQCFANCLLPLIDEVVSPSRVMTGRQAGEALKERLLSLDGEVYGGIEHDESLDLDEFELCSTDSRVSPVFCWETAKVQTDAVIQNIVQDGKLKKLEHSLLACDLKVLKKYNRALETASQHIYLKCQEQPDITDLNPESRCRALAIHMCLHFINKATTFAAVYRVSDQDQIDEAVAKLGTVPSMLLWIDILDPRFFRAAQQLVEGHLNPHVLQIKECEVSVIMTGLLYDGNPVDEYAEANSETSFTIEVCGETGTSAREASNVCVELEVFGVLSLKPIKDHRGTELQAIFEEVVDSSVEGMYIGKDDSLVIRVQTPDIGFLHHLRKLFQKNL